MQMPLLFLSKLWVQLLENNRGVHIWAAEDGLQSVSVLFGGICRQLAPPQVPGHRRPATADPPNGVPGTVCVADGTSLSGWQLNSYSFARGKPLAAERLPSVLRNIGRRSFVWLSHQPGPGGKASLAHSHPYHPSRGCRPLSRPKSPLAAWGEEEPPSPALQHAPFPPSTHRRLPSVAPCLELRTRGGIWLSEGRIL